MSKRKYIKYKINIGCEIDKFGNVIPCGSNSTIVDESGVVLDHLDFPMDSEIMIIWAGICKQWPKTKKYERTKKAVKN